MCAGPDGKHWLFWRDMAGSAKKLEDVADLTPIHMPGVMGKIFRNIPAVVISVFMISLIESLFILPAHLGHQRDHKRKVAHHDLGKTLQRRVWP